MGRALDTARMKLDLPALGRPSRPDVGEHAQLEREAAALARLAARELARRAVDARLEVHVAQAALAAAREQRALAVLGEVGDQVAGLLVADHGADRHAQLDVVGRRGRCSPSRRRASPFLARWMRAKR